MNPKLIKILTDNLIEYRKGTGVSAAHIVAAALELGYRHGQTEHENTMNNSQLTDLLSEEAARHVGSNGELAALLLSAANALA